MLDNHRNAQPSILLFTKSPLPEFRRPALSPSIFESPHLGLDGTRRQLTRHTSAPPPAPSNPNRPASRYRSPNEPQSTDWCDRTHSPAGPKASRSRLRPLSDCTTRHCQLPPSVFSEPSCIAPCCNHRLDLRRAPLLPPWYR